MAILAPHSDRAVQEYRHRSGARDTYWINELVKYVRSQGLYDSFRIYPFMPRTNADSGSTAYGLGGLTANEMQLVNGPTWGAGGLIFTNSTQSVDVTITGLQDTSDAVHMVSRVASDVASVPDAVDEGWVSWVNGDGRYLAPRFTGAFSGETWTAYIEGTSFGASQRVSASPFSWTAGEDLACWSSLTNSGLKVWKNKMEATSFEYAGVSPLINGSSDLSPSALGFASGSLSGLLRSGGVYKTLCFLTGTLTTEQRETITDLINMIGKPPPLEALREYVAETGATNTLTLDRLTRYISDEGLWDNFALYSMTDGTNYGSGSSVKVLGGLTSNDMTLVNGPTWGASGIAFASSSSQHGSISDPISSGTITVFHRATLAELSNFSAVFSQWEPSSNERSFMYYKSTVADEMFTIISEDGEVFGRYSGGDQSAGIDISHVVQYGSDGDISYYLNKSLQSMSLQFGSAQTSRYDSATNFLLNALQSSGTPLSFADQTVHALAFITGTVTTAQRETITDMINEL
jgi:hypothetical protein